MRENLDSRHWRRLIAAQYHRLRFCLNDPDEVRVFLRRRDVRVRRDVRSSAIARRSAFSRRAGGHNASSVRSVGRWRRGRWLQSIQKEQP